MTKHIQLVEIEFQKMKLFALILCLFVKLAVCNVISPRDATTNYKIGCDSNLQSMQSVCESIYSKLLLYHYSNDPTVGCCTQVAFEICAKSLQSYSMLVKATKNTTCSAVLYDDAHRSMARLLLSNTMTQIKQYCDRWSFDSSACSIPGPFNDIWNSVRQGKSGDLDNDVQQQIGDKWSESMSVVGELIRGVEDSIDSEHRHLSMSVIPKKRWDDHNRPSAFHRQLRMQIQQLAYVEEVKQNKTKA